MTLESDLLTAADVGRPDPAVLAATRAAVQDAARDRVRAEAARRRRPRRAGLLISTAAATVTALLVPVLGIGRHAPGAQAAAAVFLRSVASKAAAGVDGCDAPFWYSRSTVHTVPMSIDGAGNEASSTASVSTREIWLGHRVAGRLDEVPVSPGGRPRMAVGLGVAVFPMGSNGLTWDQVCALPTDPGALYSTIRAGVGDAGPDRDTETFVAIGDLLRESPAPPAVRSALYGAAAKVPGVTLVGDRRDAAGRLGTAVQRTHAGERTEYLIDPASGQLLEEQDVAPDGTVLFSSTYLVSGPVADDQARLDS